MSAEKIEKEIRLSPEQQAVVDSWGQGMAIQAGAGAGKTSTLVVKCAELLRKNPEAKIAAVSFTERSANDLRLKLSDHFSLDAHWVTTIHGLCGKIIRDFPRESGFTGEETMLSESDSTLLWDRAIDLLWSDTLPDEIGIPLDRLLDRETRDSFIELLYRVRELELFGVLDRFSSTLTTSDSVLAHQDLIAISHFVLERYRRLKERSGGLDFSDLERGATRALKYANVRKEFHKRFDLVMVDEFQDTNLLQAELIRAFTRPDRSNLVIVGDPKQSIYRFRDADVTVFEAFCREMPMRLSLTWNFRSRQPIIEFANRVCAPLFEASELVYEPLVAQRLQNETEIFQNVERFEAESPEALGAWIREEVRRGIPLEKMALLLRKVRGNERWLQALTAQGIPLAMGSGGLFWEDPRVREMVGFLKGWVDPANTLSWLSFLRAPWVGISDDVLDEWALKQAECTLRDSFLASDSLLASKLSLLLSKADLRPAALLLSLLVSDEIENEIGTQLLGLWHRAEELSSRGLSFVRVVDEFARAVKEKRREKDVIPPKNLGQLLVLTVHGSKGLEFEHVILLDFSAKPARARPAPLLFWDRERGAFLGERDEFGDRAKDSDLEKEWRGIEREKDLAESKRLFYVALTRAQERLILVTEKEELVERKTPASKKEPISPLLQDHWRAWLGDFEKIAFVKHEKTLDSVATQVIKVSEVVEVAEAAMPSSLKWIRGATEVTSGFKRARHSVTEWNQMDSEENIVELKELFQRQKEGADPKCELERMKTGTLVHKALELGELEVLREQSVPVAVDALMEWYQSQEHAIETYRELPFEIPVDGEVLVGAMDRVDEREDGFHLFDYKITQSLQVFRDLADAQSWIQKYRTQLILYTWALEKLEPRAIDRVHTQLVRITCDRVETWPVDVLASHADRDAYARKLAAQARENLRG